MCFLSARNLMLISARMSKRRLRQEPYPVSRWQLPLLSYATIGSALALFDA